MKKRLAIALLGIGLAGIALIANAATNTINICTSTYQLSGNPVEAGGWDTAIVRIQNPPVILVTKYAKNIRSGIENADMVTAVKGDTIEFRITWANTGEATADTVTLIDYVPTAGMSYITGSETFTSANNCTNPSINNTGNQITFTCNNAAGIDPGPAGYGEIRFRMKVD